MMRPCFATSAFHKIVASYRRSGLVLVQNSFGPNLCVSSFDQVSDRMVPPHQACTAISFPTRIGAPYIYIYIYISMRGIQTDQKGEYMSAFTRIVTSLACIDRLGHQELHVHLSVYLYIRRTLISRSNLQPPWFCLQTETATTPTPH